MNNRFNYFNWYKFANFNFSDHNYLSIGHKYNPQYHKEKPPILYIVTENGNIYTKKWDGLDDTTHNNVGFAHLNEKIAVGRFDPLTKQFSLVIINSRMKNTTFTPMHIKEIVANHFGPQSKLAFYKVEYWE